jgi:hypothetical protein
VEIQKTSKILLFTGTVDEQAYKIVHKYCFHSNEQGECLGDEVAAFAYLATHTFPMTIATCQTFNLTTKHPYLDSRILEHRRLMLGLLSEAHTLAFSRLQFFIFFFGLSDVQTGTSGQGELLYMDVSFRRSDMKVD